MSFPRLIQGRVILLVLWMCLRLLPWNARATTVIPPTFEELVDRAELVFAGKALESKAAWQLRGTNRVIVTQVQFEVEEVLKGNAGKRITLEFLGGTVGDVTLEIAGTPSFPAGESVILFVTRNGIQFCPLVGFFHGKFIVQSEPKSGKDMVMTYEHRPLRDTTEIGQGEGAGLAQKRLKIAIPAQQSPMEARTFKAKIKERIGKPVQK